MFFWIGVKKIWLTISIYAVSMLIIIRSFYSETNNDSLGGGFVLGAIFSLFTSTLIIFIWSRISRKFNI